MTDNRKLDVDDPVDYLSKKVEFLDCCLTVGVPNTPEVENIPVVRSQLVAHSSVFRDMLMDSDIADPTGSNTHIKDVRPEIFKLMLKHMYGGGLPELKTMAKEKILELAMCADKYNVRRLVEKACKQMIPKDVNTVFLPLRFLVYVQVPILVEPVTKLVQEETDKIVGHKEFLNLDDNCVEFIAKQEKLAIEEMELWRAIVKWGKSQAEKRNLTLKEVIRKPLAYVRFATCSVEELVKEVVPEEILSCTEALQLLTFVVSRQMVDIPGLCMSQERRERTVSFPLEAEWNVDSNYLEEKTWQYDRSIKSCDIKVNESSFKIWNKSKNEVALVSLEFRANDYKDVRMYSYNCEIDIFKVVNGYLENTFFYVTTKGTVVCGENVVMPLKSSCGKYCILEPNMKTAYKCFLKFSTEHPVFTLQDTYSKNPLVGYSKGDQFINVTLVGQNTHMLSLKYRVRPK